MFAVYLNAVTPATGAYMNVVYGNGGYPMLGVYDVNKNVSARSVVANTGALTSDVQFGWAARIAGTTTSADVGRGIATDSLGNVFITGSHGAALTLFNRDGTAGPVIPFAGGSTDCFVSKYLPDGTVSWAARIASVIGDEVGYAIATDTSGNVFITGSYTDAPTIYNQGPSGTGVVTLPYVAGSDVFVAKYNSIGDVQWAARIAGTGSDIGNGIATDSSGNVLVTGNYTTGVTIYNATTLGGASATTLPSTASTDCFVAKYSSAGAVVWAARIAGTGSDIGNGIATDSSGNVLVTGSYGAALTIYNQGAAGTSGATLPFSGGTDAFVAKYSSAGAVVWAARIAGTGSDFGRGIATDSSGNVVVTGYYNAALTVYNQGAAGTVAVTLPLAGGNDCFVAKYSSAGAVVWAARIGGAGGDIGYGIATDPSGNVLVAGSYNAALSLYNKGGSGPSTTLAYAGGGNDCFVAKYSSDGNVLWATRIASSLGNDFGFGIATDPSGNVLVTGQYSAALTVYNQGPFAQSGITLPFTGGLDCFIVKYPPDGFISTPTPATSNVLVSATYTSSVFSPFVNGIAQPTLAGTTLAATGLFIGGPLNYFNGYLSELIIYARTLTANERQQVEGYLAKKWGITLPTTHPYYSFGPFAT